MWCRAIEILKERYAQGTIDQAQFEKRRRLLYRQAKADEPAPAKREPGLDGISKQLA